MTPSELKYQHLQAVPDSHFFDYKTMRFFGDTMQNFGVRDAGDCWELYRKHKVKYLHQDMRYLFDKVTFKRVYR